MERLVTRNQFILYSGLLVFLIIIREHVGQAPTMNIYEFWEMITR